MSLFPDPCGYAFTNTQLQVTCSFSETPIPTATPTTATKTTTATPATASSVPTTDYFVTGTVTLSNIDPVIKVTALFSQRITCRSSMSLFPDFCAHTFRNTWLQLTSNMSPPRHCIAALPLQATIVHCVVLYCIVLYYST